MKKTLSEQLCRETVTGFTTHDNFNWNSSPIIPRHGPDPQDKSDPHLEEVEAPGVHLRMRGVDAGHHAAVQRVLTVQAQAVPRRPQESEDTFLR